MRQRFRSAHLGLTPWIVIRCALGLMALLLACLALTRALSAQDEAFWDSPFREPLYVVHLSETSTMYGPIAKDVYILYPLKPDANGVLATADGSGGYFINKAESHGGPHTTPRQVCNAVKGLPPEKLDVGFSCIVLYATEDCEAWCSLKFPHGTSDGTGDYPDCSCICVKGFEYLERDGDYKCVPCDTLCSERDPQLRYDAANSSANSCSCVCQNGYKGSGDTGCNKVDCGSNAFNIVDAQGTEPAGACPPGRRLNRHCCCTEGAVPWGGICQREVDLPPDHVQWRKLTPQNVVDTQILTATLEGKSYTRVSVTPDDYRKTAYPPGAVTFWGVDGKNQAGKDVHSPYAHCSIVANKQGDQLEMGTQVAVFGAGQQPSAPMAPSIASGTYYPHEVWVPPAGTKVKPSFGQLKGMPRGITERGPGKVATHDWTCHGFVKGVAEAYVAVPDLMEPLPDEIQLRNANVVPMKDPPGIPFALELVSGALYGRDIVLDVFLPDGYAELEGEFTVEVDAAGNSQVRVLQGQAAYFAAAGGEAIPVYGEETIAVQGGRPSAAQPFAPERLESWWTAGSGGLLDLPQRIDIKAPWGDVQIDRRVLIAGAGACALFVLALAVGAVLTWWVIRRRKRVSVPGVGAQVPSAPRVPPLPGVPNVPLPRASLRNPLRGVQSGTPPLPGALNSPLPRARSWNPLRRVRSQVPSLRTGCAPLSRVRSTIRSFRAQSKIPPLSAGRRSPLRRAGVQPPSSLPRIPSTPREARVPPPSGDAQISPPPLAPEILPSPPGSQDLGYTGAERGRGPTLRGPAEGRPGRPAPLPGPPVSPPRTTASEFPSAAVVWARLVPAGGSTARAADLDRALVTIGRSSSNDIVLTDGRVSGRHAQIERQGSSAAIRDLQSTNGTYVNGQRIASVHPLTPGDTIRLGRTEWVVEALHTPARPSAALAHLAVTRGRAEPSDLELDTDADVTIGRDGDNDLVILDDPRISRHHAQLTGVAAGHEIVDLGSTNGIAVNGLRVSRAVLQHGDRIQIGGTEFVYRRGAQE